jgi:hypothetical protein
MHDACGIIDTACMVHAVSLIRRMQGACSVIDTACMVRVMSLTPHAQKFFRKSYVKQRWYAKKLKMHALSMAPHAYVYAVSLIPHA